MNKIDYVGKAFEGYVRVQKVFTNGVVVEKNWNTKFYIKTNDYFTINELLYLKTKNIKKIKESNSWNNYLKSIGVGYQINDIEEINSVNSDSTFLEKIKNYFNVGGIYYLRYVPLIMFGEKNNTNSDVVNKFKKLNILHLFTISGFHINILIIVLEKIILKILKLKNKKYLILIPIMLLPYLAIITSPLAAIRAILFSFIWNINKYFFEKKMSRLNVLSLVGIIIFITNPYIVYSLSFIFSFSLTYIILLISSNQNNKFMKLKMYLFTWIVSMIINLCINKEINILSVMTNLFFTPIICLSYFVCFIFFWIKPLMDNYFYLIDILINLFLLLSINLNISISIDVAIWSYVILTIFLIVTIKKPKLENINPNSLYIKLINY